MATDYRPIDETCDCAVCAKYSRAHLHAAITKEPQAASLLTYHNIRHQMRLCADMHEAILDGRFGAFAREYVRRQFPDSKAIPGWVREAMAMAEISLE